MVRITARPVPRDLSAAALHGAAYALLDAHLWDVWGIAGAAVEKTERGAPVLAGGGPHISLSHTGGLVCCASGDVPLGVDCEPLDRFARRPAGRAVMERVCTARELREIESCADPGAAFLARWVLKESVSKACGVGLAGGFQNYEILFSRAVPRCAGFGLRLFRFGGFLIGAAFRA